ncbi:hypothetical protein FGG78_33785 [Thioclava sp. BHET1]|nr:hypothetical protein FGG78_33785 [Thioclava sp. BHET1]
MTHPIATMALALALGLPPTLAMAGPWARAPGSGFLALSREQGAHPDSWSALYAEFGLSSRVTLGLDVGRSDADDGTALVTLQRSLGARDSKEQFALSLGLGRIRSAAGTAALGQIGLSWGRGLTAPQRGWLSLDMRYRIAAHDLSTPLFDTGTTIHRQPRAALKADLTLGLKPSPGFWPIGQIQLTRAQGGATTSRLSLGLVTPVRPGLRLEGALLTPISGGGEPLVKIGTWLEF